MTADLVLVETAARLFRDVVTFDEIERAEETGWSTATWAALSEAGFAWVGIDDAKGGSGGSLHDLAALLTAAGRSAAPVPLAETALVGGWMLAEAGLPLPDGPLSALDGHAEVHDGRLVAAGMAAWGRAATRIVVPAGERVFSIEPGRCEMRAGANLAGEPHDHVRVDLALTDVEHGTVDGLDAPAVARRRGALSRVLLSAGALDAVARMTVDYAHQRHQFGKPIASFQAVQAHLVTATQCAVVAQMAADVAVRAVAAGHGAFEVAAARVVLDGAITDGTRAAHQAHGAMGVTREYPLHQLTRRLWAWRHEWGTTSAWRRTVGTIVGERGADGLFPLIAS